MPRSLPPWPGSITIRRGFVGDVAASRPELPRALVVAFRSTPVRRAAPASLVRRSAALAEMTLPTLPLPERGASATSCAPTSISRPVADGDERDRLADQRAKARRARWSDRPAARASKASGRDRALVDRRPLELRVLDVDPKTIVGLAQPMPLVGRVAGDGDRDRDTAVSKAAP